MSIEGDALSQTSSQDRKIPVRNVAFEESLHGLRKNFSDGDLIMSHIVASMSSLFPDGEEFFVRSVRHYRKEITDPILAEQVKGFIGQEAIHAREHRILNEKLAELGFKTRLVAKLGKRSLDRLVVPEVNLAITCAFEHFTATLAGLLLSDPEAQQAIGDEPVRNFMLWHALEEFEHRSVAFDVYQAIGGRESLRVAVMRKIRKAFIVGTVTRVVLGLLVDRDTYRWGVLWRSIQRLRSSPLMQRSVWEELKRYDQPDFHPNNVDLSSLEQRWRDELFGSDSARLSGLLARQ
ncbi:MAG TPA: metal-dependent hydrolase [Acidimicrobiaceae bacterium]|jgi:predicted metal-dependent hydrolase|nr:metal-dependent hydrolase [Acidimicrobiaceae bacterium]